jgi:hypothetical protein
VRRLFNRSLFRNTYECRELVKKIEQREKGKEQRRGEREEGRRRRKQVHVLNQTKIPFPSIIIILTPHPWKTECSPSKQLLFRWPLVHVYI